MTDDIYPSNFTAPINLKTTGATFTSCIRKCEYVVGYKKSSFEIQIEKDNLHFKPLFGSATMMYNGTTYAIYGMRLYMGNLHAWNGNPTSSSSTKICELQITHKTLHGDHTLVVCIPVTTDGTGPSVNDLIDPVTSSDPSVDYDVSRLIPNARYYTYSGTGQFNKSFDGITYVLFDLPDALYISDTKYEMLVEETMSGGLGLNPVIFDDVDPRMDSDSTGDLSVYHSADPPKSGQGMLDDIYIECKPTGADGEEEVDKKTGSGGYNFHLSVALQNDIVQYIMKVVIGFFVIICVLRIFDTFSQKMFVTKAAP